GGPFAPEQWRLIEEISRSLTPMQAQWLSGYFAGIGAGMQSPLPLPAPSSPAATRSLAILYGTETGNAAELARALEAVAKAKGLAPVLADMADYKVRQLGQQQDVLIVVSTYGEGDPPQPAVGFFEFVEGRKAPKLDGVRFAVLALGDSTYELYCEAGKRLDRRLAELGASRLAPRVDCDVDYEEPAEGWSKAILDQLGSEAQQPTAPAAPAAMAATGSAIHDKRNPF